MSLSQTPLLSILSQYFFNTFFLPALPASLQSCRRTARRRALVLMLTEAASELQRFSCFYEHGGTSAQTVCQGREVTEQGEMPKKLSLQINIKRSSPLVTRSADLPAKPEQIGSRLLPSTATAATDDGSVAPLQQPHFITEHDPVAHRPTECDPVALGTAHLRKRTNRPVIPKEILDLKSHSPDTKTQRTELETHLSLSFSPSLPLSLSGAVSGSVHALFPQCPSDPPALHRAVSELGSAR
ncbi:hypothetical protein GJAV_G00140460 [Gymnothorax javanicus]|nr:hypothetical protein GJAV_G00140460 [Gymnothorax javanicus]